MGDSEPTHDKVMDSTANLEGQSASGGPQPAASYDEYSRQQAGGAYHQSFKLNLKGERDKTRLASDKLWSGMPKFEGLHASEIFQSALEVLGTRKKI